MEIDAETIAANREAAERIVATDIAAALMAHMPPGHVVARQREHFDRLCSECQVVRPDPPPAGTATSFNPMSWRNAVMVHVAHVHMSLCRTVFIPARLAVRGRGMGVRNGDACVGARRLARGDPNRN